MELAGQIHELIQEGEEDSGARAKCTLAQAVLEPRVASDGALRRVLSAAPMRILHTESVQALGGQTLRLFVEARELVRRGHECVLVGVEGSEFHTRAPSDVRFVPFRFQSPRFEYHPLDFLRARKLLKSLAPDVVHTHSSRDAWIFGVAARSLSLPIVRGRHISRPLQRSWIGRLVYTRLADAFTASGETIRRVLIDAGVARADDVLLTPAGLDFERFDTSRREREFLRRELALAPTALIVGTACNLRGHKGVDTLIAAFELLRARSQADLHLALAGKGRAEWFAAALARNPGHIHVLGFRDDVERVLGGFDVFALASRSHEGIPQAILQAMALEVPVVATSAGGIVDVVRDGETGLLTAPDDAPAFANALERMLALPQSARDAFTSRAAELMRRDYALTVIIDRYEQAYARAITKRRAGR